MAKNSEKLESEKRQVPRWVIRLLIYVGRALLLLADWLDNRKLDGSAEDWFHDCVVSLFSDKAAAVTETPSDPIPSKEESEVENV